MPNMQLMLRPLICFSMATVVLALGLPPADTLDGISGSTAAAPISTFERYGKGRSLDGFIASYALAVDNKNESAIAALFATDAVATYTSPDQTVQGNTAIAQHDLYAFSGLSTFHSLIPMTQTPVDNGGSNNTFSAVTYFTATIFGKDCYAGQIVTAYGQYVDTIEEVKGVAAITKRVQTYANPTDPYIGNVAIVLGPACNSTKSR